MKIKTCFVLIIAILSSFMILPAMADVYTPSDEIDTKTDMDKAYEADVSVGALMGEAAEKATVENLKEYIDNKSTEVVGLMQFSAEHILLIIFMIGAFMTVIGALGNGSLVARGILGMVLCGAVYTIILFAPQVLGYFSGFFRP